MRSRGKYEDNQKSREKQDVDRWRDYDLGKSRSDVSGKVTTAERRADSDGREKIVVRNDDKKAKASGAVVEKIKRAETKNSVKTTEKKSSGKAAKRSKGGN